MIDFRYHLVSIVSIFLALAVGIVLGAGPLKEDLGNTLTHELTQLRQDKTDLRADLTAAQRGIGARDTWAEQVVAPGRGRDADRQDGRGRRRARRRRRRRQGHGRHARGGRRQGGLDRHPLRRVGRPRQADVPQQPRAASWPRWSRCPAAPAAPTSCPARCSRGRSSPAATPRPTGSTPEASQALDGLRTGGLVDVSPDQITPSSSVVLVGGPVKGATAEDTASRVADYVQLARSLDSGGSGAVVVTPTDAGDPTVVGQLVAAVRQDRDASKSGVHRRRRQRADGADDGRAGPGRAVRRGRGAVRPRR